MPKYDGKRVLSTSETVRYFGEENVSTRTLARWRAERRGPAWVRIGEGPHGRVGYLPEDLEAYLRARRVAPVRGEAQVEEGGEQ